MNNLEKSEKLEREAENMLKTGEAYTAEGRAKYNALLAEAEGLNLLYYTEQEKEYKQKQDEKLNEQLAPYIARFNAGATGASWTIQNRYQKTKVKKLAGGLFNVYEGNRKTLEGVKAKTVAKYLFA